MTKVKLKDATKELATGAGAVLSDATRVRKSADALMQSLRKLEVKFTREEEERVAPGKAGGAGEAAQLPFKGLYHARRRRAPGSARPQGGSPAQAQPQQAAPKPQAEKPVEAKPRLRPQGGGQACARSPQG